MSVWTEVIAPLTPTITGAIRSNSYPLDLLSGSEILSVEKNIKHKN